MKSSQSPANDVAPRYQQVADALRADIVSGQYPVGGHLPAEYELCERYSISRYTVREALRVLQEQGLVSRRQGAPTTVCASAPRIQYHQSVNDLEDLLHYRHVTRFKALDSAIIEAGAELAPSLECSPDESVVHVHGMRFDRASEQPVCVTDVYARAAWVESVRPLAPARQTLMEVIDELGVAHVGRVEQTLSAVALDAQAAATLDAREGAPALSILRRYFSTRDELLVIAISVHPGDRFSFSAVLRRADLD